MKLVVCVKQVPEIALVTVDQEKGELSLPQGPGIVNPFDTYAIEEALRIKEKHGGTVTVVSCGGKEAEYALREALALGADEAVHIVDADHQVTDSVATAAILSAGIKQLDGYDLILFGKQAVDSDSATIHAAVGGFLNLPAVMFVRKIDSIDGGKIVVERMTDEGIDKVTIPLPAVISVVKEINEPRLPSLKGKMMAKKKEIKLVNVSDLIALVDARIMDSASKIVKAANPPARPKGEMITGATPDEIAEKLFGKLREGQVI